MLANPRAPWQASVPPYVKVVLLGLFVGFFCYFSFFFTDSTPPQTDLAPVEEVGVVVPGADPEILAKIADQSRQQRLVIESEPLSHLLEKALDVSPTAAVAMGMPKKPIPLDELRENSEEHRGQWLWYEGVLEDLNGPRDGHPIKGHSIYEATVRLPDGERVITAFSIPPGDDIHRGGFVRTEGFLMKLRDTTYPQDIAEAPMLVGRQLLRDYEDWAPVTEFDPSLLADIVDTYPGTKIWHDVKEDQGTPLWHLAAFARDTADDRTFEQWRQIPVLSVAGTHDRLVAGEIERGTPMRILGTLVKRRVIKAPPNPAGIEYWTVAWILSRDYASHIVPVWVPKKIDDIPLRTDLEVRGYYYRWLAYESIENLRLRVPLFIAADLNRYDIGVDETMQTLGLAIAIALILLMALIGLMQWSGRRQSERHAREMDARRRRRREREAAVNPGT